MLNIVSKVMNGISKDLFRPCPMDGKFGAVNTTVNFGFMDVFPTWMLPSNENIIEFYTYTKKNTEFMFLHKFYLRINSGRQS